MKRIFTYIAVLMLALPAFAQDDVRRPDSYNYQSGVDAYNSKDYAKSMEFFDKELEHNPKNGYAMVWQAYIYDRYERYGSAIEKLNRAVSLIPKKDKKYVGLCHKMLGKENAELGDTVTALREYEAAFRADNDPDHLYEKCNIYNEQGRFSLIDTEIKRVMAISDKDAVAWVYAGRNDYRRGDLDAAVEKYSYAARLAPDYSSAFSYRAEAYTDQKKYKEAVQDVIKSLSIDSDSKAYLQLYDLADKAMGVLAPQLKAQQLKEHSKSKWSYYLGIMYAYLDRCGEADEALAEAERIADYDGSPNEMIYVNRAEVSNELGMYVQAIDMADRCLALDSTYVRAFISKHYSEYYLGRNMAAIETMNQAARVAPDDDRVYYYRARVYMYSGQARNALDDINTAISLAPERMRYYNQRAEIYRRLKDNDNALKDCRHIIDTESAKPSGRRDHQVLAFAYARSGQKDGCLVSIDSCKARRPDKADEYDIACMYSLIGERDSALACLEKTLDMGYRGFVQIDNDTDLDNIRQTDRFRRLVAGYKAKCGTGTEGGNAGEGDYTEVTTEVPFTKANGVTKVQCTINGLPLHFIFDTGASDVTISSVEAQFMLKNDYLLPSDVKGRQYYGTASGDIAEGTVIVIKDVSFGGLDLTNIKASVVHNQQAPLLLGQTVLGRLGRIEIDNTRKVIRITGRKRKQ